MGLWIFAYDDATPDEIEAACKVAAASLAAAGVAPAAAQQAAHDAADLSHDFDGPTPGSGLVVAWYNAEYAAFEHLQNVAGEWPNGASLIYVEQGE